VDGQLDILEEANVPVVLPTGASVGTISWHQQVSPAHGLDSTVANQGGARTTVKHNID